MYNTQNTLSRFFFFFLLQDKETRKLYTAEQIWFDIAKTVHLTNK